MAAADSANRGRNPSDYSGARTARHVQSPRRNLFAANVRLLYSRAYITHAFRSGGVGAGTGRHLGHERHDVHAWLAQGLRRLGATGQPGLGLRRRAALLHQERGQSAGERGGLRLSRGRRAPHRHPLPLSPAAESRHPEGWHGNG